LHIVSSMRTPLLQGLSVVNTGINLPAALAGGRFSELGASVVKVEPPTGEPLEVHSPEWYARVTQDQQVVQLNLKLAEDRDRLERYLSAADVLVTSARPAALDRLGLGWQAFEARFPRLVQVALVGYPPPRQNVPGHDLTYVAHLGLVSPPELPRTLVADLGGTERIVSTALALVFGRDRPGAARYAEVALADAAAFFAGPWDAGFTAPGGVLGGGFPGYGLYEASEGWVAVAAIEPHFLERLRAELELERADHAALAGAFRGRTAEEWERWAEDRDLPIAAVS
jgi:crotonobetainyl-CoA:carnitine CoA-transferase CaiB-like acyl-CoA transferase